MRYRKFGIEHIELPKSRIAATLAERLQNEPHLRLRHFCSPYHQDSALLPFIGHPGGHR
jgi:hypothetical protein